ncbi:hypothetical protein WN71_009200 [Streptomyces mangrovisoli]|uniref:FAD-binding domain-containing protein n=1 Tax=Streptomyces mangrovisoli TaxID=1428628 RepID=A0A1J4P411_9ACTN|nr:hypothetical protein WN71_009200 [Streptomyces mangrovisoli]
MAAAVTLSQRHEVEVYEGADRLRTDGNGVLLYPNATGILGELGVSAHDVDGARMQTLDLVADGDSRLMRLDLSRLARAFDAPILVTKRGHVLALLAAKLPEGMVRFGKRAVAVEQSADGAAVVFEDGTRAEGDVVLGADGHRSAVRRLVVGEKPAAYLGDATWHGITALPHEFAGGSRIHSLYGKEGICVVHPVGGGEIYWAFELPFKDGETVPPRADGSPARPGDSAVANLRERFGHWTSTPMPTLLETITDADVGVFPHILHGVRENWSDGAVTLLGDAAHAVPPRLGMGLCQALEDAWVLGRVLAQRGVGGTQALRQYEALRWPRMRKMHSIATMMGRRNLPLPPGLLRVVGGLLPMTSYQKAQLRSLSNYLNDDAPPLPSRLVSVA